MLRIHDVDEVLEKVLLGDVDVESTPAVFHARFQNGESVHNDGEVPVPDRSLKALPDSPDRVPRTALPVLVDQVANLLWE